MYSVGLQECCVAALQIDLAQCELKQEPAFSEHSPTQSQSCQNKLLHTEPHLSLHLWPSKALLAQFQHDSDGF